MSTSRNTLARSVHDLGLAAWFGGSLMGAIGVNRSAAKVARSKDTAHVAGAGWSAWTPVNLAAIGAYLAGGAAHPGPGMPMVLMSGWIAADALDQDRAVPKGAAAPEPVGV